MREASGCAKRLRTGCAVNRALLLLTFGVGAVTVLPVLPPLAGSLVMLGLGLAGCLTRRMRLGGLLLAGLGYGLLFAHGLMLSLLPHELESEPLLIEGVVVGTVQNDEQRVRFDVLVDSAQVLRTGEHVSLRRVRLNHYRPRDRSGVEDVVVPEPGELWTWIARLKRPRGFANPGGFDYQVHLLRQGVSAVGYISGPVRRLTHAVDSDEVGLNWPRRIDRIRQHLSQRMSERLGESEATLLKALIAGDQNGFSDEQWQWLRDTGTVHLVIISGLHISMLAGLGFMAGGLLGRLLAAAGHTWPAQWWGALTALAVAIAYAALAGFSMPTQRAVVMVSCGLAVLLMRRQVSVWHAYCAALLAVLLINPLAVTGAGFWLSFMAVASLLLALQGRRDRYVRALLMTQAAVTLGLVPWLLLWIGTVPLTASLVNLIAVPWVGVVILPLGFATLLLDIVSGWEMDWLWRILEASLGALWWAIEHASQLPGQLRVVPSMVPMWLWFAAMVGTCLVLMPLPWRIRWLGIVPLVALVSAAPRELPHLRIALLDVGQGLAVVVQAEGRTLVYDTGPEYSPSFNAGEGIVAPYLSYFGVKQVDYLVLSHRHLDHTGGAAGLMASIAVVTATAGEPELLGDGSAVAHCEHGYSWEWGAVSFSLLQVGDRVSGASPNNHSCMVLIRTGSVAVLLSGDIEQQGELALLADDLVPERLSLLQAGHHGSNTSSSEPFLAHTQPEIVVFSRGYKHRFGHPHPDVVKRVEQVGARHYDTALHGAIVVEWDRHGDLRLVCWRDRMPGFWIERPHC